jgi:hypothetical protein
LPSFQSRLRDQGLKDPGKAGPIAREKVFCIDWSEGFITRRRNECIKVNRRLPGSRTSMTERLCSWIGESANAGPLPVLPKHEHPEVETQRFA